MNHKALVPGMLLCLACSSGTPDDLKSGISAGFPVQGISVPPYSSDPSMKADYFIVEASYDPALDRISATVTSAGPSLLDFVASGNVLAAIVPRSFRLTTGSVTDSVGDSEIRILFDAARADTLGRPDESTRYSSSQGALTGDPSQLNMDEWDFVRFQVEFVPGATGKFDALAEPTALNHLRVPFRF